MAGDSGNPMDAMMGIFMAETTDFLSKIEDILITSEQSGEGIREATPEIFRIMHTIKSSSAMMSLDHISRMAHKVEDLFYYLRENPSVAVDEAKLIDIVLEAVDFVKRNLDGTEKEDPSQLVEKIGAYLEAVKRGEQGPAAAPTEPRSAPQEAPVPPVAAPATPPQAAAPESKPQEPGGKITLTVWFRRDCQMLGLRSLEIRKRVEAISDHLMSVPEDPSEHEELVRENGLLLLVESTRSEDEIVKEIERSPFVGRVARVTQGEQKAAQQEQPKRQFVERRRDSVDFGKLFINVETNKLDNLVDLVGEIQILQMELAQSLAQRDWEKGESSLDKLKKMILSLQEATLSTRMIPVRETFLKMNRLVRDMCRKQDKEIEFITKGEETEVDRSIIDHISSPLMHIIRNAIDHGIEDAERRATLGKPPQGRVELSAYTEGRNVIVVVEDDGKGLDSERILEKAVSTGIVTEAQAMGMPREEINALIFLPGFSTNQEVTEFSGRGVGMDVVNENLKAMNGKVIVQSEPDKGTKVLLKIPLTLAIIDTMLLRVGEDMCAVPVSSVEKFFYMSDQDSIRNVNGEDLLLIGDECYRILNLFEYYHAADTIPYEEGVMIVVNGDTRRYVAFASEVMDRQDVVVKPAPPLFKTVRGISGCTVLGDGRISLILDTDELLASQNDARRSKR